MKIHGLMMGTEAARMAAIWESAALSRENVDALASVQFHEAFLTYDNEANKYRPSLTMVGRIRSLSGEFPEKIKEVDFGEMETACPEIQCRYEFSDTELVDLINKGLYDKNFEIPALFTNEDVRMEIPVSCDCNIMLPQHEKDVPILFVRIRDAYEIETNMEHSHYRLADNFPYLEEEKRHQPAVEDMVDWEHGHELDLNLDTPEVKVLERPIAEPEQLIPHTTEGKIIRQAYKNIETRVDEKLMKPEENEFEADKSLNVPEADVFVPDEDLDYIDEPVVTDVPEAPVYNEPEFEDDIFLDEDQIIETEAPPASVRGLGSLQSVVDDIEEQQQAEANRQAGE